MRTFRAVSALMVAAVLCGGVLSGCRKDTAEFVAAAAPVSSSEKGAMIGSYENDHFLVVGTLLDVEGEYIAYGVSVVNKTQAPIALFLPGGFDAFLGVKCPGQNDYRPVVDYLPDLLVYEKTLGPGEVFAQRFRVADARYRENGGKACRYRLTMDRRVIRLAKPAL